MTVRILVAENSAYNAATHGVAVKAAISTGYGSDISAQIQITDAGYVDAYNKAIADPNIIAIVHSYASLTWYIGYANYLYSAYKCLTFMPLGSNSFIPLSNPTAIPSGIVTCGAGDVGYEDQNNTAYGYGLEFWDNDGTPSAGADVSSYSTGIICGKMLKIKDTVSEEWVTVRERARLFADRAEANRTTSPWDYYNGYGIINIANAIAQPEPTPEPTPIVPDPTAPESILSNLHYYSVQHLMNKIIGETDHTYSIQECANIYYGNTDLRQYSFQEVINLLVGHSNLTEWSIQECLNYLIGETNLQAYSVQEALSLIWNKVYSQGLAKYNSRYGIKYNATDFMTYGVQNV